MKYWSILALLVAVCAVFLKVGFTEKTADDFREAAFENVYSDSENNEQLTNSVVNANDDDDDDDEDSSDYNDDDDDDKTDNALDGPGQTPGNDDDEVKNIKRFWLSRRRRSPRRRRRSPRRRRTWGR